VLQRITWEWCYGFCHKACNILLQDIKTSYGTVPAKPIMSENSRDVT